MANEDLPRVVGVDAIGTQPKPSDTRKMAYLTANENVTIEPVTYIVRVALDDSRDDFGGKGFWLYVGERRIEKYSGYREGIFFKVYDPRFFDELGGQEIRLTEDGENFVGTGQYLPTLAGDLSNAVMIDRDEKGRAIPSMTGGPLPTQEEVLK